MTDWTPGTHSQVVLHLTLRRLIHVAALIAPLACTPTDDDPLSDTGTDNSSDGGPTLGPVTPELIASGGSCVAGDGPGIEHGGDITADETWSAADGPHRVTSHLRVLATLTLEPCTRVEIDEGIEIEVGSSSASGRLVALGEATTEAVRPILLEAVDPAAPWGRLLVWPTGELDMSVAGIIGGGGATTDDVGALVVRGVASGTNGGEPVKSTTLDRVLVSGSASHGLHLAAWGALTEASTEVWIRYGGSGSAPSAVRIEPGVGSSLPSGLEVSGNVRDEILVQTSKAFMRDDRWAPHGVPYRQVGILYVNAGEDGRSATLTIEPGVSVTFADSAGSGIIVGSSDARPGALVADGTAAAPIHFTSAEDAPAPGDWMGVIFRYATASRIVHARIEHAGGESGTNGFGCGPRDNDAAIIVHGQGPDDVPPDLAVTDTQFDYIGGESVIVSGWVGSGGPMLSETNTFGTTTGPCKVSRPRPTPDAASCDAEAQTCWP